jgi:DNA-binding MarR family transcriptional regulator
MSSDDAKDEARRAALLESVLAATRQLTNQGILFSQSVAERFGLAVTDTTALEQLSVLGTATAGRIAELTGLTTGAATRMIDRLEQSGFVRRTTDPADRRRVIVEPIAERVREVEAQYAAIRAATRTAIERYADDELGLINDFLTRSLEVERVETARVGEAPAGGPSDSSSFAPLGGTSNGRLVFLSGAPYLTISGDPELANLYRAKFSGAIPRVRVRDGVVTIRYGRLSWFEWRTRIGSQVFEAMAHWRDDRGDIVLNGRIPWTIEVRGGVSKVSADLRQVDLAGLDVAGGTSSVELNLPAPKRVVRIRVAGGANDMAVHRPVGTAVRLAIRGGANKVTFDGQQIHRRGQVSFTDDQAHGHGWLSHETSRLDPAAPYYEIDLAGGANRLTVDTK